MAAALAVMLLASIATTARAQQLDRWKNLCWLQFQPTWIHTWVSSRSTQHDYVTWWLARICLKPTMLCSDKLSVALAKVRSRETGEAR